MSARFLCAEVDRSIGGPKQYDCYFCVNTRNKSLEIRITGLLAYHIMRLAHGRVAVPNSLAAKMLYSIMRRFGNEFRSSKVAESVIYALRLGTLSLSSEIVTRYPTNTHRTLLKLKGWAQTPVYTMQCISIERTSAF